MPAQAPASPSTSPAPGQFRPAPGVQYRTMDGIPGQYFDCTALKCSMATTSCARSWRDAQNRTESRCHGCATGACHAGATPPPPVEEKWRCARCGPLSATSRVLHDAICISCYNRSREALVGVNGKGTFPRFVSSELHPAWAIVRKPATPQHTRQGWSFSQKKLITLVEPPLRPFSKTAATLTPSPSLWSLPNGTVLVWAVAGSELELKRIVEKRVPGGSIEQMGIEPSFTELHEAGVDASWWLIGCMPAEAQRHPFTRR